MEKKNIIREKSFDFALEIIDLNKKLIDEKEYVISRQLLKSGTSIGANVEEAGAAQSKKDFIAKMSTASKEARETKYWLRLLKHSDIIVFDHKAYLKEITEIVNVLTAIVKSSQQSFRS